LSNKELTDLFIALTGKTGQQRKNISKRIIGLYQPQSLFSG
jgi:hypothetical protein